MLSEVENQPAIHTERPVRRFVVNSAAARDPEPSLLEQLGMDYKAFKKLNPNKTARIPAEIKDKARDAADGGAAISEIARVTGLSTGSIKAWLKPVPAAHRKSGRKKKLRQAPLRIAEGESLQAAPENSSEQPKALAEADWMTIRIRGREVDIRRVDFWGLF